MQPDEIDQYDDVLDELRQKHLTDEARDAFAAEPEHGEPDWAADLFDAWLDGGVLGEFDRRIESWVSTWLSGQEQREML